MPILSLAKPEIRLSKGGWPAVQSAHFWPVFFLLQALLLICYWPVLRQNYAFCDDFYYLARSLRTADWLSAGLREALLQGRPVDGLVLDLSFLCLHRLSDLVILRLLGIFGAACLAFCSYIQMLRAGWPKLQSICLSICFVTVPAFQVYISWAVAAPHVFSSLGAYLSVVMAETATQQTGWPKARILVAAIFSMFLSLGLYQPSAMFFWLFAAMIIFKSPAEPVASSMPRQGAKLVANLLTVFGGACALELGVFESAKHYFGTAAVLPQRSHLTTHIAAKINWFISGPFVDASNFQRLQPSSKSSALISAFLAIGLFLYFRGNFYQRLAQWAGAICLIPLSYLPNLAIAENFITYRTEAGLAALLVFYVFLASVGIVKILNKRLSYLAITCLSVVAAGISMAFANYNVSAFFVVPQTLELGLAKSQQDGAFGKKVQAHPFLFKRDDTLAPFSRYDEFGLPSLCQPWVPDPVAFLIKRGLVGPNSSIRRD